MKTLMSRTEKFFATTELEAKSIVEETLKSHGSYVKHHSITKKTKKGVDFFVVVITIEFYAFKDLAVVE